MLIAYTPGATTEEIEAVFDVAAKYNAACYVPMRANDQDVSNLEEVLTPARRYGTQLHIVHLNSSGRDRAPDYLAGIRVAQAEGIDVTTECYPYNRGSAHIDSHVFDD